MDYLLESRGNIDRTCQKPPWMFLFKKVDFNYIFALGIRILNDLKQKKSVLWNEFRVATLNIEKVLKKVYI